MKTYIGTYLFSHSTSIESALKLVSQEKLANFTYLTNIHSENILKFEYYKPSEVLTYVIDISD